MPSYTIIILLTCLIGSQIYLLRLLWICKRDIENKNIRLIQFYLDMKFIWQGFTNSLNITNTIEFCYKFIEDIKDYFSLDDIIIVDSLKMARDEKNTPLRRAVIDYVRTSSPKIEKLLRNSSFLTLQFTYDSSTCSLYVTSITPEIVNDGLIIAVERHPTLLSKNELISLENSINLLKTRLVYN